MLRRGPQHACFELRHYQMVELARRHVPEPARDAGTIAVYRRVTSTPSRP